MMECGDARRILLEKEAPQPLSGDVRRAEDHVAACPDCRGFLSDMRATARGLHRCGQTLAPGKEVRDRLFQRLARERVGASPRAGLTGPVTAAAVIALAGLMALGLGLGYGLHGPSSPPGMEEPMATVAKELQRSVYQRSLATSEPERAREWLAEQVPFPVEVPELPDADLVDVRRIALHDRAAAALRYQTEKGLLAYYVLPRPRTADSSRKGETFRTTTQSGYRVVGWHHQGRLNVLVGQFHHQDLLHMAEMCADQVAATSDTNKGEPHG